MEEIKKYNRLEYLYPNITDLKRKEWLKNATFLITVNDSNILPLTFEEYIQWGDLKKRLQIYNTENKNITKEVNKEDYETWKKYGTELYNFLYDTSYYDTNILHKIAVYLSKNPLALPHFIQKHALQIIGKMLQLDENCVDLYSETYLKERKEDFFKIYSCERKNGNVSEGTYRINNFFGKYNLSLFLGVVEELLDLGINLKEYRFTSLKNSNTYKESESSDLWNKTIIENIKKERSEEYLRNDNIKIKPQELLDLLSFDNLDSFLEKVVCLTQREAVAYLIEDEYTIDPKEMFAFSDKEVYKKKTMSIFPQEKLITVDALCQRIHQKLINVQIETRKVFLAEKVETLGNIIGLNLFQAFFKEDRIKEIIQKETLYENTMNKLDEYLKMYTISKETTNKNSETLLSDLEQFLLNFLKKDKKSSAEEEIEDLKKQVQDIHDRLNRQDETIKKYIKQIEFYIENGGAIPREASKSLSKECIMGLLKEHRKSMKNPIKKYRIILLMVTAGIMSRLFLERTPSSLTIKPPTVKENLVLQREELTLQKIAEERRKHFILKKQENSQIEIKDNLFLGRTINEKKERISYYPDIYQETPMGYKEEAGIVIAYFALKDENGTLKKAGSFRNQESLNEFLKTNDPMDFEWKAAVCAGKTQTEMLEILKTNGEVPYDFTDYFIDINITENQKKYIYK